MRNKIRWIIPYIGAFAIFTVGVLFWSALGAGSAVTAQNEIRDNGFYYNGEAWMTPESFKELKQSLSERDYSIQTSSDLEVLPEIRGDGSLLIKYSFFSIEIYENLNRTRDFPQGFKQGFAIIPTVVPILFFAFLIMWAAMNILPIYNNPTSSSDGIEENTIIR